MSDRRHARPSVDAIFHEPVPNPEPRMPPVSHGTEPHNSPGRMEMLERGAEKDAARIAKLEAENARLRAALQTIIDYEDECHAEGAKCRLSNGEYDRARAALRAGKEAGR